MLRITAESRLAHLMHAGRGKELPIVSRRHPVCFWLNVTCAISLQLSPSSTPRKDQHREVRGRRCTAEGQGCGSLCGFCGLSVKVMCGLRVKVMCLKVTCRLSKSRWPGPTDGSFLSFPMCLSSTVRSSEIAVISSLFESGRNLRNFPEGNFSVANLLVANFATLPHGVFVHHVVTSPLT